MPCIDCKCENCINYFNNIENKRKILYINDGKTKLCSMCKIYKDVLEYPSNGYGGIRGECKVCRKKTNRAYYLRRKEKQNLIKGQKDKI